MVIDNCHAMHPNMCFYAVLSTLTGDDNLRLCLFYVINDIVQASVKRQDNGVMANKIIDHIVRAVRVAAEESPSIMPKLGRTVDVWADRNIYPTSILNKLSRIIKDRQKPNQQGGQQQLTVSTERHQHQQTNTDSPNTGAVASSPHTPRTPLVPRGIGPEKSPLVSIAAVVPDEDKEHWQGDHTVAEVLNAQHEVEDQEVLSTYNENQYPKVKARLRGLVAPEKAIEASELLKSHKATNSNAKQQNWTVTDASEVNKDHVTGIRSKSLLPILEKRRQQFVQDKEVRQHFIEQLNELLERETKLDHQDDQAADQANKTLSSVKELREQAMERLKSLQEARKTAMQKSPRNAVKRGPPEWDTEGLYAYTPIDDPQDGSGLALSLDDDEGAYYTDDEDEYNPYDEV